jgi:multiple sugar transport system substrate-binding protein
MARTLRPLLALLVLALAGIAAGCGGDGGGGAGERKGSVSFLVFGDPEELQAYRDVIAAYERQEPDVHVTLIEASDRDDLLARLSTGFAGGKPPDLFLINYRFYGQFASKGVLEPLEERVENSELFELDDFYPTAVEAFRWNGELTCMPQNVSSAVIYYNKDLFAKYGVEEPAGTWTWDDMVAAATKLTKNLDGKGRYEIHGLGVEPAIIRLAPFVWSNGGEIVDDPDAPTRLMLDTPEAQEALQKFFDLRQTHGVLPTEAEVESEDLETRFSNGRLGMLMQSRRETPSFRTITAFDWDVAPLPILKEPAGILHSDAYCMTEASKNKEAAWGFVEFALGAEGQRIAAKTGRTVPSLKEVAESDAFLDPNAKPAHSQVWLDAVDDVRHVPTVSTWPEIEDAVEGELERGLFEGASPEEVARRAEAATTPIFARAEH